MFTYGSRSTRFINLMLARSIYLPKQEWPGFLEDEDRIWSVVFEIGSDSKVITRTRRKFWDDVSLRGG